jgi:hypothetical protein
MSLINRLPINACVRHREEKGYVEIMHEREKDESLSDFINLLAAEEGEDVAETSSIKSTRLDLLDESGSERTNVGKVDLTLNTSNAHGEAANEVASQSSNRGGDATSGLESIANQGIRNSGGGVEDIALTEDDVNGRGGDATSGLESITNQGIRNSGGGVEDIALTEDGVNDRGGDATSGLESTSNKGVCNTGYSVNNIVDLRDDQSGGRAGSRESGNDSSELHVDGLFLLDKLVLKERRK